MTKLRRVTNTMDTPFPPLALLGAGAAALAAATLLACAHGCGTGAAHSQPDHRAAAAAAAAGPDYGLDGAAIRAHLAEHGYYICKGLLPKSVVAGARAAMTRQTDLLCDSDPKVAAAAFSLTFSPCPLRGRPLAFHTVFSLPVGDGPAQWPPARDPPHVGLRRPRRRGKPPPLCLALPLPSAAERG